MAKSNKVSFQTQITLADAAKIIATVGTGVTILLRGEPITHLSPDRLVHRGMGFVPQEKNIFPSLTVEENLEMGAFLRRGADVEKDFKKVFDLFPRLKEREFQAAGTMSGGEQQMLAIGRALMGQPKILLLDEPSMGLAPILVEQIFDIIREINQRGTAVLLVEQNARLALEEERPLHRQRKVQRRGEAPVGDVIRLAQQLQQHASAISRARLHDDRLREPLRRVAVRHEHRCASHAVQTRRHYRSGATVGLPAIQRL